jgi:hypothetical protein
MKYEFDVDKWIQWLLPSVVRRPLMIAWLKALLMPIKAIHNRFYQFKNQTDTSLKTNGQVFILRGLLNDMFDFYARGIELIDGQNEGQTWVFLEEENKPLYMPVFLTSGEKFDFVVRVPLGLKNKRSQIEAVLNRYKLPSKKYKIELYG